jgi:hypothetical protein
MDRIESSAFAASVLVASSKRVFLSALTNNREFVALTRHLSERPDDADRVLARLRDLSVAGIDPKFQNPHDVPLAAYTWAVAAVDRGLGAVAAEVSLGARQTWWAREIATEILEQGGDSAESTEQTFTFGFETVVDNPWNLALTAAYSQVVDVPQFSYRSEILEKLTTAAFLNPWTLKIESVLQKVQANEVTPTVQWYFDPLVFTVAGGFGAIGLPEISIKTPERTEGKVPLRLAA